MKKNVYWVEGSYAVDGDQTVQQCKSENDAIKFAAEQIDFKKNTSMNPKDTWYVRACVGQVDDDADIEDEVSEAQLNGYDILLESDQETREADKKNEELYSLKEVCMNECANDLNDLVTHTIDWSDDAVYEKAKDLGERIINICNAKSIEEI